MMDSYACPCGYNGQADLTAPVICAHCHAVLRITRYPGGFKTVERQNERGGWTFVDMSEQGKPRIIP